MAGKFGATGLLAVAILLGACGAEIVPSDSPLPSGTPEVKPTASPSAEPAASVSPSASARRSPVRESAQADALFHRADACTNSAIGYSVTFPDDWYTNTAIGEQAACTWFTPDFFEVDVPGEVPEEVWISIGLVEGIVGYNMLTPTESGGEVEVDGYAGHWTEYRNLEDIDDSDSNNLTYHYVIPLDRAGPTLVAATGNHMAGDYELAKAVLDRMMASMELDPAIARVPTIPEEPTGPVIRGDPISREDADGSFRLTLGADQDRYRAGQEIRVMATLIYLGPADAVTARGSSNPGLIGFRGGEGKVTDRGCAGIHDGLRCTRDGARRRGRLPVREVRWVLPGRASRSLLRGVLRVRGAVAAGGHLDHFGGRLLVHR